MDKKIAFIGGGRMGEALIKGVLESKLYGKDNISVSDTSAERLDFLKKSYGLKTFGDNREMIAEANIILLCVKPQGIDKVLENIADMCGLNKLIISIAAGITIAAIKNWLPGEKGRVIRVMPNTPAMIGEGMSAISGSQGVTDEDIAEAMAIFGAVGKAVVVKEEMMDAVTGLSGSGPAFIYMVIESMADAGVKLGLARDVANLLAAQTVKGAAEMALNSGRHIGELRDMVVSPGGTTIAGLYALEKKGLKEAMMSAVEEAAKRSMELGKRDK